MELLRSINKSILIEGHRGAEGLAPENSWDAIEAGYQAGADLLELDIQRTRDGQMIMHNGYQLADGRWIHETDFSELKTLRPNGKEIVSLPDVLLWVKQHPTGLVLDVKNGFGFDPAIFFDVLEQVESNQVEERVVISGWDHAGLLNVKLRNTSIKTLGLLRGRPVNMVEMAKAAKVDAINLDADMISQTEVDQLHSAGIAVVLAELIDPDFRRPVRLGVDVVCCRDPLTARRDIEQFEKR